jgi:hypothetical protein
MAVSAFHPVPIIVVVTGLDDSMIVKGNVPEEACFEDVFILAHMQCQLILSRFSKRLLQRFPPSPPNIECHCTR